MRRFAADDLGEAGAEISLGVDVAKHVRVVRLEAGTEVELFDGRGGRARAELLGDGRARILERLPDAPRTGPVLMLGLTKLPACELALRVATELGARDVHLVVAERSVVRSLAPNKTARLERIVREAARQSERAQVPDLYEPAPLPEVLDRCEGSARMVAWARAGDPVAALAAEGWIAIGPEGGWTDEELARFDAAGFRRVAIARHVVRADTAVAAALALAIA